jgi:hypothetical protein
MPLLFFSAMFTVGIPFDFAVISVFGWLAAGIVWRIARPDLEAARTRKSREAVAHLEQLTRRRRAERAAGLRVATSSASTSP